MRASEEHLILIDPHGAGSLLASQFWRKRHTIVHCVQNVGELSVVLDAWPESPVVADTLIGAFPDEVMRTLARVVRLPLELVVNEREAEHAEELGWRPVRWPDDSSRLPDAICAAIGH